MLVLARKTKQSIRIGDNVIITVVSVQGDQVRLGITAPRNLSVLRQELYEEIVESNLQASRTTNIEELLTLLNKLPQGEADIEELKKK